MSDNFSEESEYQRLVAYKNKLYNYVSSLKAPNQPSKQLYSVVTQCHIESNKKHDSFNYCSTCFTENAYQWRIKLHSRKQNTKQGKCSKRKFNELVMKCVVCHAVQKLKSQS